MRARAFDERGLPGRCDISARLADHRTVHDTCIDDEPAGIAACREAILSSFADSFARRYRTRAANYSAAELDTARRLVETKFATREWTHRVP